MTNYSFFTFDQKDEHGRYVGNIVYGEGGIAPFYKCYDNYKPNRKGGHTHNHLKNKLLKHRYLCESKRHKNERYLEDFISRRRYIPAVVHDILNRNSKTTRTTMTTFSPSRTSTAGRSRRSTACIRRHGSTGGKNLIGTR